MMQTTHPLTSCENTSSPWDSPTVSSDKDPSLRVTYQTEMYQESPVRGSMPYSPSLGGSPSTVPPPVGSAWAFECEKQPFNHLLPPPKEAIASEHCCLDDKMEGVVMEMPNTPIQIKQQPASTALEEFMAQPSQLQQWISYQANNH